MEHLEVTQKAHKFLCIKGICQKLRILDNEFSQHVKDFIKISIPLEIMLALLCTYRNDAIEKAVLMLKRHS